MATKKKAKSTKQETVKVVLDEKQDLLNEWKIRLGLQNWNIILRYNCEPSDLELQEASGETSYVSSTRAASIRILSEKYFGDRMLVYDFEEILVHELLHIKFAYLQNQNGTYESKILQEKIHQLIEDLAQSLVMAKRHKLYRTDNLAVTEVINYRK